MFYPEFEEKIKSGEILVGDLVWVAGYQHADPLQKPERHVPPTLVQVMANADLPYNRNTSSIGYHFRACGKSGKLLARVINPYVGAVSRYDPNEGSLYISFMEEDAKVSYVAAAKVAKGKLAKVQQEWIDKFARLNAEIDTRISKNE